MSKIKINLDRVGISSDEILKKMSFEDILVHHQIMAKPFYKTAWFYGVSGLATVSLIAGSIYPVKSEGDELVHTSLVVESAPDIEQEESQLINDLIVDKEETQKIINKEKLPIEKINTLLETTNQEPIQLEKAIISDIEKDIAEVELTSENKTFSFMDLYPRISGRINGGITKEELLNDEGLVTNSNIKIISFQLHLVDASGGKVFESGGNVLNTEMKTAINTVNVGEEIYFEKIDGESISGEVVRLSPLRYVLLN